MKIVLVQFLLLHLIKCVITSESEDIRRREPRYLFAAPKTFTSGQNETVCMSLYDAAVPAKVQLDLKIKEKHHVVSHTLQSDYECFEIRIPQLRQNIKDVHTASIHLQVQINGSVYSGHTQTPILIYPNHNVIFIQTDKNIYKPNDKVRFRILILTQELKAPNSYSIPEIKILNPGGITVTVWEHIPTDLGLVQLEHHLSQDASLGKWTIKIGDITRTFQVKEYILQRFVAILSYPKLIYIYSTSIKFTVCGKYAFGQHVKGIALIKISFTKHNIQPVTLTKELVNGCAVFEFAKEDIHLLEQINSDIHITATVTEKGSSRVEIDRGKSHVTNKPYKLKFVDDNKHFQPGLPYRGKLKAVEALIPLQKEVIEICYNVAVEKIWNIKDINQCSNFNFGPDGIIYFYIPPVKDTVVQIRLQAKALNSTTSNLAPTYISRNDNVSYFTLNRWYSPTNSYIQIEQSSKVQPKCRGAQQFIVYYTTTRFREYSNITFHYMVKSRNKILKIRSISHITRKQSFFNQDIKNIVGGNNSYIKTESFADKYILKLKIDAKILSKFQLVVYYTLPNAEVVAASLDANVEKCLMNKVDTSWSHRLYSPGERATVTIKTADNSLCALSVLDKSLYFSGISRPLNIHTLLKPFLVEKAAKTSNKLNCLPRISKKVMAIESTTTESSQWDLRRRKRSQYGMTLSTQFDSYEAFNNFGVYTVSNLRLVTKPCVPEDMVMSLDGYDEPDSGAQFLTNKDVSYDVSDDDEGTEVRSFFPETWLWELIPVRSSEIKVSRDLPHTITNWLSNTVCVSPTLGVGLSPQTEITTFKPFFVEVITPYSIKRGETLHLEMIVFNYLNYSIPVRVTIGAERLVLPDYPDEKSKVQCIPAQDSKTVVFRLQGTLLGKASVMIYAEIESSFPDECGPEVMINRRDMVLKEILVQPEGYPFSEVKSALLCANEQRNRNNISWSLELPDHVIPDSAKATVMLNADLLGPTIQNLEKLLIVPTGCGEQIMAMLAPNLYILEYLNATGKLTTFIRQRTLRNLKIGYQRILDYVHKDGSFSAFGYHDRTGSMFLTAFVVKILQQCKAHIYIDQNVINHAVEWIINNQLENGCFATVSHVFHDMGGSNTENSSAAVTSYVLISLLEVGIELEEKIKTNAKYCIRGHFSTDKYTLALSSYALALVGWESEANRSLTRLLQMANRQDNLMWWSSTDSATVNIEMTSYILMSLLHQNTSENLVYANSIVRWLSTQRGANGGFVTTQDTAVALNAVSKYALMVHNKDANLRVNISTDTAEYEIIINIRDRLQSKMQNINVLPSDVDITVEGDGCVLVQTHLQYNLDHIESSEAFQLAMNVDSVSTTDLCSVAMVSPCISYTGVGLHSNMAILEITMPSGYEPDRASLFKLMEENNSKVKRFEENENQVILYFTELSNEAICVPFNINENSKVDERVDANVKLYDYYNPNLYVLKTYQVNKCEPNRIAPIPSLTTSKQINDLSNDYIPSENYMNITNIESYDETDGISHVMNNENVQTTPNTLNINVQEYKMSLKPEFINLNQSHDDNTSEIKGRQ